MLRMETDGIRAIGRATQGVRLIDIEDDDRVVGVAKLDVEEAAVDTPPDIAGSGGAASADPAATGDAADGGPAGTSDDDGDEGGTPPDA